MADQIKCWHCDRIFANHNDIYQHTKWKHRLTKAGAVKRKFQQPRVEAKPGDPHGRANQD